MAIKTGTNFDYKGPRPNFERDNANTINDMFQMSQSEIEEGHIIYCKEDKNHYIYKGENINYPKLKKLSDIRIYRTSTNFNDAIENIPAKDILIDDIFDDSKLFVDAILNGYDIFDINNNKVYIKSINYDDTLEQYTVVININATIKKLIIKIIIEDNTIIETYPTIIDINIDYIIAESIYNSDELISISCPIETPSIGQYYFCKENDIDYTYCLSLHNRNTYYSIDCFSASSLPNINNILSYINIIDDRIYLKNNYIYAVFDKFYVTIGYGNEYTTKVKKFNSLRDAYNYLKEKMLYVKTYDIATENKDGLMSKEDKNKLDGLTGAYVQILTQNEYNNLENKKEDTVYFIK